MLDTAITTILDVDKVSQVFSTGSGEARAPVLSDVSMRMKTGEIVALLGRSGSGKSTLLRLISGLTRPTVHRIVHVLIEEGLYNRAFVATHTVGFERFAESGGNIGGRDEPGYVGDGVVENKVVGLPRSGSLDREGLVEIGGGCGIEGDERDLGAIDMCGRSAVGGSFGGGEDFGREAVRNLEFLANAVAAAGKGVVRVAERLHLGAPWRGLGLGSSCQSSYRRRPVTRPFVCASLDPGLRRGDA